MSAVGSNAQDNMSSVKLSVLSCLSRVYAFHKPCYVKPLLVIVICMSLIHSNLTIKDLVTVELV